MSDVYVGGVGLRTLDAFFFRFWLVWQTIGRRLVPVATAMFEDYVD